MPTESELGTTYLPVFVSAEVWPPILAGATGSFGLRDPDGAVPLIVLWSHASSGSPAFLMCPGREAVPFRAIGDWVDLVAQFVSLEAAQEVMGTGSGWEIDGPISISDEQAPLWVPPGLSRL